MLPTQLPTGKVMVDTSITQLLLITICLREKTHQNLHLLDEIQSPVPVVVTGQRVRNLKLNNKYFRYSSGSITFCKCSGTKHSNVNLHSSWMVQISRLKSHSFILSISNRKHFQSVFGFHEQSASF